MYCPRCCQYIRHVIATFRGRLVTHVHVLLSGTVQIDCERGSYIVHFSLQGGNPPARFSSLAPAVAIGEY